MRVSVIVTTKNEEGNIGRCLESVRGQSYNDIEIIVVDNDSSDRTKEIAKKFTDKVYSIEKHIDLNKVKNFRGAQLNFGVKKSKGELIFFPDADMTFDVDLISEAVKKSNKFDAFYVPEVVVGKGFFGKIRNFERSFYNETCIDAVRFVRRDLFLKVGGFDEKNIMFSPDDWDFTKMIKLKTNKITITKSKLFHHEEQLDLRTYLNKKKGYTDAFDGYIQKWGKDDEDVKKQFGPYYRLFGVFIENEKWINLLKHPILSLGLYWIRFRVGLTFLINH